MLNGETLYNRKNIIQGQTNVPLSGLGEKQAQCVATRLQNDRFTHVFASDLARAHKTAKIITDANKVCRCEIILDERLRERKFGTAEGKSSKELLLSAKKAKRRYIDYTPPGAETVFEVQERVKTFFKDLCTICIEYSKMEDTIYRPGKIKRRHGGSLGRNSGPNKRLELSRRSQSFCGSGNIQNIINEMNMASDQFDDDDDASEDNLNFCQHSSIVSMQDSDSSEKVIEEYRYRECFPSSSDDSNLSSDLKSYSGSSSGSSSRADSDDIASSEKIELNGNDSDSTLSESVINHVPSYIVNHCEIQTDPSTNRPVFRSPSPIKHVSSDSHISSPGCPNVSLSPTIHQRLPSISSISSGRNSSFDDSDCMPTNVADILVVSHGGYIKEMMRYFVETLDCKIPGMKGHALKVCPNCSLSKFTITLDEDTREPTLTCITIHDKDHLIGLDMPDAKGLY